MASIFIHSQTSNWKLKYKQNGKYRQVTLRKVRSDDVPTVIPPDVRQIATRHGAVFTSEKPAAHTTKPNPQSLHEFIAWCLADYAKTRRKDSVVLATRVVHWFRDFVGDVPINTITSDTVRQWADSRLKTVSGRTVVSNLSCVSAMFKTAVNREILAKNPVSPVLKDFMKAYPQTENIKYLTDSQVKQFLYDLDATVSSGKLTQEFADLYKVMLGTGLRREAACQLRWEWITSDWRINVPPSTDDIATKTKKGYTTSMSKNSTNVLKRLKQESKAKTGRIFPTANGNSAHYYLKRYFGFYPHQLRHTVGTGMVDAGMSIQVIGACLGHSNLQSTQVYAKVRDKAKADAYAKLPW